MKTYRRAAPSPFVTCVRVATGIIGGAIVLVTGAVAAASFVLARRVITPAHRTPDTRVLALDLKAQTITLTRTPDTELPGRYGLQIDGSDEYIKLGSVLAQTSESVTRKLMTHVNTAGIVDNEAMFSGWYYNNPDELQLDYSPELISTPIGMCPAWMFPGDDTWVIVVHGRGVTRAETLRSVPVFAGLGYSTLVVSYRNDTDAPASPGGSYGLGSTEWIDVDAAMAYAQKNGAKRIILMGWSMGGAIVMQSLMQAKHASLVAGVILDSPVIDWREVLAYQAKLNHVPATVGTLAVSALNMPWTAKMAGAEQTIPFDELNVLAHADALNVPVLLMHSDDDGFVPSGASRELAKLRPDLVTLESFGVARHTKLWNYDEKRWSSAITAWAGTLNEAPAADSTPMDIASVDLADVAKDASEDDRALAADDLD